MAAGSPLALVLAVRRRVNDFGAAVMKLQAQLLSGSLSFTPDEVPEILRYGDLIEIDVELMETTGKDRVGVTVARGMYGTTAATHASGSLAIVRPRYTNEQILASINEALFIISSNYPRTVVNETLTTLDETYEYTLPTEGAGTGTYFGLTRVEIESSIEDKFIEITNWDTIEGITPFAKPLLRIKGSLPSGRAIRLHLLQSWPELAIGDATLPSGLPVA